MRKKVKIYLLVREYEIDRRVREFVSVMKEDCFLTRSLIAHRGLHDVNSGIIENSVESFKLAIDKNYIIELDVHILKDGEIVVFHDDNLHRVTGVNKKISEVTYNEIKELKLKNTNSYIPKLQEVLKLVDGKVPLLIEIKNNGSVRQIRRKISRYVR